MANILDFWRNEWRSAGEWSIVTDRTRLLEKKNTIIPVSDKNKRNISQISWGETSGIYPTKNTESPSDADLFEPSKWDDEKTKDLLKARAAIHLIGTKRNGNVHKAVCSLKGVEKILAAYHLTDNFPKVDSEILNHSDVRFFYLSSDKFANTPSIDTSLYDQKRVKTYGPFYNIGGGDAVKGIVYIHFYKAIKKT